MDVAVPTDRTKSETALPRPACAVHLAAQLEDRQPQVADDPGDLPAEVLELGLHVRLVGPRREVVEHVAEERQLLGDPVVDLAGQALPLLRGGDGPDLAEQQRGLDPQRGVLDQVTQLVRRSNRPRRPDARGPPCPSYGLRRSAGGPSTTMPGVPFRPLSASDRPLVAPGLGDDVVAGERDVPVGGVTVAGQRDGRPGRSGHEDRRPVVRRERLELLQQRLAQAHRVEAAGQLSGHGAQLADEPEGRRVGLVPAGGADTEPARPGGQRRRPAARASPIRPPVVL